MVMDSYCWILAVIKSAYLRGNLKVVVNKHNRKIIQLLKVLLDVGFITNFYLKSGKIFIYLRYINGRPVWRSMHICYKKSSSRTVSKWVLGNYMAYDKRSVFIISTHIGIISTFAPTIVGGKLICVFA